MLRPYSHREGRAAARPPHGEPPSWRRKWEGRAPARPPNWERRHLGGGNRRGALARTRPIGNWQHWPLATFPHWQHSHVRAPVPASPAAPRARRAMVASLHPKKLFPCALASARVFWYYMSNTRAGPLARFVGECPSRARFLLVWYKSLSSTAIPRRGSTMTPKSNGLSNVGWRLQTRRTQNVSLRMPTTTASRATPKFEKTSVAWLTVEHRCGTLQTVPTARREPPQWAGVVGPPNGGEVPAILFA